MSCGYERRRQIFGEGPDVGVHYQLHNLDGRRKIGLVQPQQEVSSLFCPRPRVENA